ncbi:hypothetical protein GCM10008090_32940 [Arenicella chitinivorans]|uniref:Uncharacterized protein n=1 Tax=Arenicella chitinivorans TaxID=1329800 RepID=A0A918S2B4_9GAMM|nr:hypothetical protein GCM10008090_32940 [Arenicella chitinivorans]
MEVNLEKSHVALTLEKLPDLFDKNRVSVKSSEDQIELFSESDIIELQQLTCEQIRHIGSIRLHCGE